MITLTPDEETYLLRQPEVVKMLMQFNRAAAMREVSQPKRMTLLDRFRAFEALTLPARWK